MIFIRNAKELLAYTVIIFLFSHNILGKEKKDFKKSYFGSILAGQIANYRNETDIASEYFDYANKFNPKNKQIFNQSLMSLILSGKVDEAIKEGKLREDLYYRIGTIEVNIPPLRERIPDIVPLSEMFLKRYVAQAGRQVLGFTKNAQEKLKSYDWPGNVRQLQNEIQRAALMCEGEYIDHQDLSIKSSAPQESPEPSLTLMEAMEFNTIKQVLKETGGNKLEAARRLGIGRQTLYNKIKAYSIPV